MQIKPTEHTKREAVLQWIITVHFYVLIAAGCHNATPDKAQQLPDTVKTVTAPVVVKILQPISVSLLRDSSVFYSNYITVFPEYDLSIVTDFTTIEGQPSKIAYTLNGARRRKMFAYVGDKSNEVKAGGPVLFVNEKKELVCLDINMRRFYTIPLSAILDSSSTVPFTSIFGRDHADIIPDYSASSGDTLYQHALPLGNTGRFVDIRNDGNFYDTLGLFGFHSNWNNFQRIGGKLPPANHYGGSSDESIFFGEIYLSAKADRIVFSSRNVPLLLLYDTTGKLLASYYTLFSKDFGGKNLKDEKIHRPSSGDWHGGWVRMVNDTIYVSLGKHPNDPCPNARIFRFDKDLRPIDHFMLDRLIKDFDIAKGFMYTLTTKNQLAVYKLP